MRVVIFAGPKICYLTTQWAQRMSGSLDETCKLQEDDPSGQDYPNWSSELHKRAANSQFCEQMNLPYRLPLPLLAVPYYCTTTTNGFVGILGKPVTLRFVDIGIAIPLLPSLYSTSLSPYLSTVGPLPQQSITGANHPASDYQNALTISIPPPPHLNNSSPHHSPNPHQYSPLTHIHHSIPPLRRKLFAPSPPTPPSALSKP